MHSIRFWKHPAESSVVAKNVVPLLDRLGLQQTSYLTNAPKDAGRIGQDIVRTEKHEGDTIKVIVAGGDGTAHELIEGIVGLPGHSGSARIWQLIILPLGTVSHANKRMRYVTNDTRQMLCMPHFHLAPPQIYHPTWRPLCRPDQRPEIPSQL